MIQEAETLKKLDHPFIPKVVELIDWQNEICIVTEYIPADNLAQQLDQINISNIKDIVLKLLNIILYLKKHDVVHRDIKPENILWNGKEVFLVDFGLSLIGKSNFTKSVSTVVSGTLGFIAPEQLRGRVDYRADVYSLGVTIACILTNTPTSEANELFDDLGRLKTKTLFNRPKFEDYQGKYWINWLKLVIVSEKEKRSSIESLISFLVENEPIAPQPDLNKQISFEKNKTLTANQSTTNLRLELWLRTLWLILLSLVASKFVMSFAVSPSEVAEIKETAMELVFSRFKNERN